MSLLEKLRQNAESDMYPFHMPGHKRNRKMLCNPYALDITEIDGFDNLHHPEGILKQIQEEAAKVYGVDDAFLLINGSTGGILSAVAATTEWEDTLLIGRNCHKSVYHAAAINHLNLEYLYPSELSFGINNSIMPEEVEAAFVKNPAIKAVVITSPTYDGVVSDVAGIAETVHSHGAVLIVDEAHGAHFGFSPYFPRNAAVLGADYTIMSLHKTLPSFTQTAVLACAGSRYSKEKIMHCLNIYETSSPSYLLMAGMERCICEVSRGKELFDNLNRMLEEFYQSVSDLKVLEVFNWKNTEIFAGDKSKILISTKKSDGMTGQALYDILRETYHLQLEMAAGEYVVALTSICDREEGFKRLSQALHEIDSDCTALEKEENPMSIYTKNNTKIPLFEAMSAETRTIDIKRCEGEIAAEFVYLYPPGIPILVPGEEIPSGFARSVAHCKRRGMHLEGLADYRAEKIKIVEKEVR